MPHLLIAGKLHPAGLALLEGREGFTYDYVEEISEPSYAPLIGKADALVIRTQPLSAATIAAASRLKIVSRHGVGYDSVDVAALNKRQIPLCIVGDVNSLSVAEHAMMLILACAKRLIRADRVGPRRSLGVAQRSGGGRNLGQEPADHRLRPLGPPSRADGARIRDAGARLRSVPCQAGLAGRIGRAGRIAGGRARLGGRRYRCMRQRRADLFSAPRSSRS